MDILNLQASLAEPRGYHGYLVFMGIVLVVWQESDAPIEEDTSLPTGAKIVKEEGVVASAS